MAGLRPTARVSATIGVEQNSPISTPGWRSARVGGDGEVAGRDQLAAGRGSDAVDLGDHRLWQVDDRQHQLGACAKMRS